METFPLQQPMIVDTKRSFRTSSSPLIVAEFCLRRIGKMMNSYFFLALIILAIHLHRSSGATHPGDILVLKSIKSAIAQSSRIPPSSCVSSWDFTHDPCDSHATSTFICGFTCEEENAKPSFGRRIVRLELDAAAYSGKLPASIASLQSLLILDLSQNSFFGSIPSEISKLKNLQKLDLSGNRFAGQLPQSVSQLTQLQYLSVADNKFSGEISVSLFASMNKLERLYLQKNRFSGSLPSSLSKCLSLLYLDASSNAFTDNAVFSKLPKSLIQISLRQNAFSAKLNVPQITAFQALEVLDLSANKITGQIPSSIFRLPKLQQLNLSWNNLSAIDLNDRQDFSRSELIAFDSSHNSIGGKLPIAFSKLTKLSALSLSNNLFTDRIPDEYAQKAASAGSAAAAAILPLTRLLLNENYLHGDLPTLFLKPLPNLISASFTLNCLNKCPADLPFCHGSQRPQSQC